MTENNTNIVDDVHPENNENAVHFKRLGSSHDINSRGILWYKQNLNDAADYALLFRYLSEHLEEHMTGLRPHLVELLRAQVKFQILYAKIKQAGVSQGGLLVVSDDALEELTAVCKELDIYKRKFSGSSHLGKAAAGKVLLDLSREAKRILEAHG